MPRKPTWLARGGYRHGIGAALLFVVLSLAATARAETGVTADTIKLGMFGPLTGPVSIYGYPINNGAIAIYKWINDQGGIHDRKIEIVHEDGACDPAKTRAAVKKLISRDEVFAVHGGNCSAAVFAAKDIFVDEKVPLMVMAATLDKIVVPTNRYIFTTTPLGSTDGQEMVKFLRSMPGVHRIAIIRHTDEWTMSRMDVVRKDLPGPGVELVAEEVLDRGASDATTQVLKIKEAKPDVTLFITYPAESAVFLRDARKYGLEGPFVGALSVQDMLDLAQRAGGLAAVKDTYATAFLAGPLGSPELQEWTSIFQKYFPNDRPQSLSFYGMSGAFAVIDALRRAGPDLTREKFIAALEATSNLSAGPQYCKVAFSPTDHVGCRAVHIWTVRDGKIAVVGETWPGGPLR